MEIIQADEGPDFISVNSSWPVKRGPVSNKLSLLFQRPERGFVFTQPGMDTCTKEYSSSKTKLYLLNLACSVSVMMYFVLTPVKV